MIYMKNCKNDALLVRILVVFSIFHSRNPRGTLFRAGSPMGSNTPLYYLVHENPYQRSCWGKNLFKLNSSHWLIVHSIQLNGIPYGRMDPEQCIGLSSASEKQTKKRSRPCNALGPFSRMNSIQLNRIQFNKMFSLFFSVQLNSIELNGKN